jgi:hypothetical protein
VSARRRIACPGQGQFGPARAGRSPLSPIAANLLSHHLKVLRETGLVTTSRRGRWIDYALAGDALARLHAALPGLPTPGRVQL